MGDSLQEFLVNVKSAEILVSIGRHSTENYASEISTQVDCTYSHTVRIIQKYEERGLLESNKEGRKKVVELTDDGEKVAEDLRELMSTLEKADSRSE